MAEKEILTNILKMVSAIESLGQTENLQLSLQNLKTRKMYIKILIFIGPILVEYGNNPSQAQTT